MLDALTGSASGFINSNSTNDRKTFEALGNGVLDAEKQFNSVASNPNANPGELAMAQANLEREKRKLEAFAAGKKVLQDMFKTIIDMVKSIR